MHARRSLLIAVAVQLGVCGSVAGQLPGTGSLAMPAIIEPPTPPEAVEMWQRSAANPSALFAYLDREALRKSLEQKRYDSETLGNLLLNLEYMAVERLGDIGGIGLISRLEDYVARKVASKEYDAATTGRLTIERIRLRARGRDAYIQAMLQWLQTPEPPPPPPNIEEPPERSHEQLSKDSVRRVIDAARALGVIQAVEAVPTLIQKRQQAGWNTTVYGFYISRALARIGDPRALDTLRDQIMLFAPYVQSALVPREPDEPDVAWAYWQMRTRGMPQDQAIQDMIRSLGTDSSALQGDRALCAIGKPAVPALLGTLAAPPQVAHPDWLQNGVVWTLGMLRAVEAVPALRDLLRNASGYVQEAAARSLGQIGDPSALDDLMEAAQSHERGLQHSAIWALRQIGDARATSVLLALARDSGDVNIRYWAVDALGDLAPSSELPALEDLLTRETSESVRYRIKAAIEKVKTRARGAGPETSARKAKART